MSDLLTLPGRAPQYGPAFSLAPDSRCARPNRPWNQFHTRDLGTRAGGGLGLSTQTATRTHDEPLGPALLAGPFFGPWRRRGSAAPLATIPELRGERKGSFRRARSNAKRQLFQSTLTQALGVALARLGKLDDLSSDRLTNWIGIVWGRAERRKRHLKCNSHLMDGLGVEATCTLQIR